MPQASCVGFFLQKAGETEALGNLGLQELVSERQGVAVFQYFHGFESPIPRPGDGKNILD